MRVVVTEESTSHTRTEIKKMYTDIWGNFTPVTLRTAVCTCIVGHDHESIVEEQSFFEPPQSD